MFVVCGQCNSHQASLLWSRQKLLTDVCYGKCNNYQVLFVVCGQGNSYLLTFVVIKVKCIN